MIAKVKNDCFPDHSSKRPALRYGHKPIKKLLWDRNNYTFHDKQMI